MTTIPTDQINVALAAAKPGDYVKIPKTVFPGPIPMHGVTLSGVILDLFDCTFNVGGLNFYDCAGIEILGGEYYGISTTGVGLTRCKNMAVRAGYHFGARNGIGVGECEDFEISHNFMDGMTSDGIDLALSQRGKVFGNTGIRFKPQALAHPDFIQLWSRTGGVIGSIACFDNFCHGEAQGINMFNHVRNGVDDGGSDNVALTSNIVMTTTSWGLSLAKARSGYIADNRVVQLPGAPHATLIHLDGDEHSDAVNNDAYVSINGAKPVKQTRI